VKGLDSGCEGVVVAVLFPINITQNTDTTKENLEAEIRGSETGRRLLKQRPLIYIVAFSSGVGAAVLVFGPYNGAAGVSCT
jgi:hypothetical protein